MSGFAEITYCPSCQELFQRNALLEKELAELKAECNALKATNNWFNRQLFGRKSERQRQPTPGQDELFDLPPATKEPETAPEPTKPERTHKPRKDRLKSCVSDEGLRFDDSAEVQEVRIHVAELKDVPAAQISEKVTYRLAQRRSSYVVLKIIRPVLKVTGTKDIVAAPTPANVLESSMSDVSLLAGMLVDKFVAHLPLNRQYERIKAAGIQIARSTLLNYAGKAIDLLRPIAQAQQAHILKQPYLMMDETPCKAGISVPGKMRQAYIWPMMSLEHDLCFTYASSRSGTHVASLLKDFSGTLLTDGYEVYAQYAREHSGRIRHALCWAHARRYFDRALNASPQEAQHALNLIGSLYHQEGLCKKQQGDVRIWRQQQCRPIVESFFAWVDEQRRRTDLLPKEPLSKALNYAFARRTGLMYFLDDPLLALDTNALERALRPIPMGRKNWMFCWTELGAERLAVIQTLLASCRMHEVNPSIYLIDVLQRIQTHPDKDILQLTPRVWKTLFAENPMRSVVDV